MAVTTNEKDVKQGAMMLLPPAPDRCQVCAAKHEPDQIHDKRSLYYQYAFYGEHGRWPTWEDAMKHLNDEQKEFWKKKLTALGIDITK